MTKGKLFRSFGAQVALKLLIWEAVLILAAWVVYQWANWGQRFSFSDVLFLIGALELGVASGDARRLPQEFKLSGRSLPSSNATEHTPAKTYFLEDLMENHSLAARLIASGLLTMLIAIVLYLATR